MSDTKLSQIMYTLGEIAGVVWPDADIPTGVRAMLLSRPYDGLRMMRDHDNYKRVPIERLTALLDHVPPKFSVPEGRLTDEHTQQFWAGFLDAVTGKELVQLAAKINATPSRRQG